MWEEKKGAGCEDIQVSHKPKGKELTEEARSAQVQYDLLGQLGYQDGVPCDEAQSVCKRRYNRSGSW